MNTKELLTILRNMSFLLEVKGDNPFKSRAYSSAADIIEEQGLDIEALLTSGTLGDVKGFGKALVTKIAEFASTGKIAYYENLTEEVPETILELRKIPGLGPKKIGALRTELAVSSVESLEAACLEHKVAGLKGFGQKSEDEILRTISRYHSGKQ